MDAPHVCIDRSVPPPTLKERMALIKGAKWLPGDAIRAGFMDGDSDLRGRVQTQAQEWTRHVDLELYFGALGNADIRISFSQDPGSWSYIGTQCHSIPANEATMNFGWLTKDSSDEEVKRVVLHEFGHALGCIHEHQNPAGGIKWNKPAVYKYYEGPPNNWSRADVDQNLFRLYDEKLTVHTKLDPKSIMMYPIPKAFTLDGFEVGLNSTLSTNDVAYIKEQYS